MENFDYSFRFVSNFFLTKLLFATGFFKTIEFYQKYIISVDKITNGQFQSKLEVALKLFSLVLTAKNYAFLYLFHDSLSLRQHVLYFNWVVLSGFPPWFNLCAAVFVLFSVQTLYVQYFQNNGVLFRILQTVFQNQTLTGISALVTSVFHFQPSTPVKRLAWSCVSQKRIECLSPFLKQNVRINLKLKTKNFALGLINLLNLAMPMMCK